MEATREIYWNVGHGVILPMYLLAFVSMGLLVRGFWKRLPHWRQGKSLNRFDRCGQRVCQIITGVFGQVKVVMVKDGGIPHSFFFWGFLTLFVGTLIVMLQADFLTPLVGVNILTGDFYKAYSLVLDLAGIVAILMLAGLFIRRFVIRPEGLETVADDYLIHSLLFTILVTGFFIEGVRMAATEVRQNPALAAYSPGGLLLARLFFMNLAPASLLVAHQALWWLHLLLALGFIAVIPYSKLKHIFTTSANYFLVPLEAKGTIPTINLEEEGAEEFGVAKVSDLTWKDIFDTDACTNCKRCQDRCPAYATGKPLSPMKLVQQIGASAGSDPQGDLIAAVSTDVLWSCTTCRACQEICPAQIEHVNKILEMRRNLVLMQGAFPGNEVMTAFNNLEVNGNPFGLAYASRGDWAEGLDIVTLSEDPRVDVLYFVGCYASFDKRNREIARSFVSICNAAGIKVGILGKEEKCCGEPLRKLGNEYLYQMVAQENIELIKGYGIKKIVTTCPHCFNTLSRDYKDLGLDLPVEHHATFIKSLIDEGKLVLNKQPLEVTYHDSCYLARYKDIVQEPRHVLDACGVQIKEMAQSGSSGFCCGAGGGRILAEEKLGTKNSEARVKMASETGTTTVVSNCPFCLTMFEDGIKTGGFEGGLVVNDLAEIVAARVIS